MTIKEFTKNITNRTNKFSLVAIQAMYDELKYLNDKYCHDEWNIDNIFEIYDEVDEVEAVEVICEVLRIKNPEEQNLEELRPELPGQLEVKELSNGLYLMTWFD